MAWYDPAEPGDPNASYLSQNPAIRDAMLAFGTQLLANARKPGMAGVGEGLQAGFNTWAGRREQYAKEARQRAIDAMLAAGHPSPIGAPLGEHARDPGFRAAYDLPLGTPVPTRLESGAGTAPPPGWQYTPSYTGTGSYTTPGTPPPGGTPPGTTLYRPGTNVPTPEALAGGQAGLGGPAAPAAAPALPQSPFGPGPWGTAPSVPPAKPTPPELPQSPFGPGPWGTAAPIPQSPFGPGPWGTTPPAPTTVVPLGSEGPTSGAPFQVPGPITQNSAPGLFNPSPGPGTAYADTGAQYGLSNTRMTSPDLSDADQKDPLWKRNNNPGNLRYVGQEGAEKGENGFARFPTMEAGVAATKRQLERYGSGETTGKPLTTLRQIIGTYSPPGENQTDLLIQNAARRMGVSPDQPLDIKDPAVMDRLADVITQQETGRTVADLGGGSSAPRRTQVAENTGAQYGLSNVKLTGGEAAAGAAPSNVARMSAAGVPEWKMAGLLEQAGAGDTGGMYDAQGNLSEDTKRTLRLANAAGGPEGVQQMLMSMANRKPEIGGTAETGYFSMDPWSGKIKQLTEPRRKGQDEDITDQVPYKVAENIRVMRDSETGKEYTINTAPGSGVTVQVGDKADQGWFAAGLKQSTDWTAGGRKLANSTAQMAPVADILRQAVLDGREISGWGSETTLPLRRAAQSMGLPFGDNVTEQEMIDGLRQGLMTDLHEPGMGSSSDWESQAMVAAGPSLNKSTEGNYILVKGIEAQAARKLWLGRQSEKYMDAIDPVTHEKRNHLKGFDEWLNTEDPTTHRKPIDEQPHLMTDTSKMSADEVQKNTKPGDVLFVDGHVKVRPNEFPDTSKMTPADVNKLHGKIALVAGQLRYIP